MTTDNKNPSPLSLHPDAATTQKPNSVPTVSTDIHARAQHIKCFAFDVDGVCTDGKLYYGPNGEALHAFYARDGYGLVRARQAGFHLIAISGRRSPNVSARLGELKVPNIHQGIADKEPVLDAFLQEQQLTWAQCAYLGDDDNDIACIKRAGLGAAVADAADGMHEIAVYVTRKNGGYGALREVIELVMRAQNIW